ncbi:PadR family transcriptional regulator [Staphylococcus haemolyticus]|uniref:PadR family transcriptional regulator n=1 Tax=Staphylococcus haemolyticus TaxID=1283 RepID=UPI001F0AEE6E|nr:PadR family transcriptional regulator [Staphylococcus haemolyticus]MCH4415250.1 PadR family transcriptional regulator [Staphylococcus haemolyticus]
MSVSNQMMKGLLDGAILGLIAKGETYGYEILEKLNENQFPEVSDGSIYPVLLRLSKKRYVHTTTRKSDNGGPKRKYYTISESGQEELERFKEKWSYLNSGMNNLFGSDEYDD